MRLKFHYKDRCLAKSSRIRYLTLTIPKKAEFGGAVGSGTGRDSKKDIDFELNQIIVRAGKAMRGRSTMLPIN